MMARVERESWGRLSSGEEVHRFVLASRDGLSVTVSDLGATLLSVQAPDQDGSTAQVLLGLDDPEDYEASPHYFGSTLGRYAGRIGHGRFALDGELYQLPVNLPPHHLHGGPEGFSHRIWEARELQAWDGAAVLFRLRSPAGDSGYPGTLEAEAQYRLEGGNRLRIRYRVEADAPTHVNLANHACFNLAGGGEVGDHHLRIPASRTLPRDATGLPTGDVASVAGSRLDFRAGRRIGEGLEEGGYDDYLLLDGWDRSLRECARLTHPGTGRRMTVSTTLPGLQVCTPDLPAGTPGREGRSLKGAAAICLEPRYPPDAPNQPSFPSTRLDPGTIREETTILEFGVG